MNDPNPLLAYQHSRSHAHLAQLINTHTPLVYSVALRITKKPHLAEDITQEVFLTLTKKAPTLKPTIPLEGWLFTTTRLLSLQSLRATARRNHHESEAAMSHHPATQPDPLWPLISSEIDQAVADLSTTDQGILLLRYYSGKSTTEIASLLAISETAAKKRLTRALDSLQKILTSRGLATTTALTLAAALTTHAVHAAPPALAPAIHNFLITIPPTTTLTTKGAFMASTKSKALLFSTLVLLTLVAILLTWLLLPSHPATPPTLSLPFPITLDSQTTSAGPTITITRTLGPSDSFSLQAQGTIDLSNNTYRTNAAGIIIGPETTNTNNHPGEIALNATGSPPGPPYPYGAILLGNSALGFHPIFPANPSTGLGNPNPPQSLSITEPLSTIFGNSFILHPGDILEFRINDDQLTADNSGAYHLSAPN